MDVVQNDDFRKQEEVVLYTTLYMDGGLCSQLGEKSAFVVP